jgi:hypothetical protein
VRLSIGKRIRLQANQRDPRHDLALKAPKLAGRCSAQSRSSVMDTTTRARTRVTGITLLLLSQCALAGCGSDSSNGSRAGTGGVGGVGGVGGNGTGGSSATGGADGGGAGVGGAGTGGVAGSAGPGWSAVGTFTSEVDEAASVVTSDSRAVVAFRGEGVHTLLGAAGTISELPFDTESYTFYLLKMASSPANDVVLFALPSFEDAFSAKRLPAGATSWQDNGSPAPFTGAPFAVATRNDGSMLAAFVEFTSFNPPESKFSSSVLSQAGTWSLPVEITLPANVATYDAVMSFADSGSAYLTLLSADVEPIVVEYDGSSWQPAVMGAPPPAGSTSAACATNLDTTGCITRLEDGRPGVTFSALGGPWSAWTPLGDEPEAPSTTYYELFASSPGSFVVTQKAIDETAETYALKVLRVDPASASVTTTSPAFEGVHTGVLNTMSTSQSRVTNDGTVHHLTIHADAASEPFTVRYVSLAPTDVWSAPEVISTNESIPDELFVYTDLAVNAQGTAIASWWGSGFSAPSSPARAAFRTPE